MAAAAQFHLIDGMGVGLPQRSHVRRGEGGNLDLRQKVGEGLRMVPHPFGAGVPVPHEGLPDIPLALADVLPVDAAVVFLQGEGQQLLLHPRIHRRRTGGIDPGRILLGVVHAQEGRGDVGAADEGLAVEGLLGLGLGDGGIGVAEVIEQRAPFGLALRVGGYPGGQLPFAYLFAGHDAVAAGAGELTGVEFLGVGQGEEAVGVEAAHLRIGVHPFAENLHPAGAETGLQRPLDRNLMGHLEGRTVAVRPAGIAGNDRRVALLHARGGDLQVPRALQRLAVLIDSI